VLQYFVDLHEQSDRSRSGLRIWSGVEPLYRVPVLPADGVEVPRLSDELRVGQSDTARLPDERDGCPLQLVREPLERCRDANAWYSLCRITRRS
jgi:hypothetical protein